MCLANTILAQFPESFKYQAVLRDGSGNIVASAAKTIKVELLQGSITGTVVFSEDHAITTNAQGLFNLNVGTVSPTSFAVINWANAPYFIKISVNGVEMGTSQLLSVPYALYAKKVEGISNTDIQNWNSKSTFSGKYNDLTGKPDSASFVYINGKQTIQGKKIFADTIDMNNNVLVNLSDPVNDKDAVNKAYIDRLIQRIEFMEIHTGLKVEDIDGNDYSVVVIGSQEWIGSNLKATRYNNGDPIPLETLFGEWSSKTTGAYCYYDNQVAYRDTFGLLYNYYAVIDSRNICPAGFHVPTDAEWTTLITFLGGTTVAGGKLKESGVKHWIEPNTDATDDFAFSALPGGYRNGSGGAYQFVKSLGYFWSSSEFSATNGYMRYISNNSASITRNNSVKSTGYSVRCIRD